MIRLDGVSKSYLLAGQLQPVLRDVSLGVAAGELVALVGRSGSGKSTLLNLIGGIDAASAGVATVCGTCLGSLSETALARWRGHSVGFVFQFFQLMPTLTALENVLLAMDFVERVPVRDRRGRAMDLLAQVQVADRAHHVPARLSGGEQQRVAIARALANEPPLILADEPTGNLDSDNAATVYALLSGLARDGRTVVVVTHDTAMASRAPRVVTLVDGRIAHDSTFAEVHVQTPSPEHRMPGGVAAP